MTATATGRRCTAIRRIGTGEFQERLDDADIESGCRTQQPSAPGGLFTKNRFNINLGDDTVTCPNNVTVSIRRNTPYAEHCSTCPLRPQCTTATAGRTISVSRHEAALVRAVVGFITNDWATVRAHHRL